jgi:xanthine/uracil permease
LQGPPARSISPVTTALASVQWLFFMFANTVVIPISIGYAFHQPPAVITASLERAFIYTGIACLLQGTIGHRLPLMEGSAGLWWGVILSLAAGAQAPGQSLAALGGTLEAGIILTGLIIILLGVTGLGWWLRLLFPPVVTSTFYFLLGAQLCEIFFKGMLGLSNSTHIEPGIALLSLGLVVLVLLLSIFGRGLISNFAILTGIIVGWIAFVLLCWLLRTSVHKTAELRQYNRSHLPSCLHEKTHKSGNSRRGKLMLNAYTYTSLINQVEKQHVLLVSG